MCLALKPTPWRRNGSRYTPPTSMELTRALTLVAVLAGVWYATTDLIPVEFVQAMPYVITLVVLALASQRLRPPAADGQPYRKGEG